MSESQQVVEYEEIYSLEDCTLVRGIPTAAARLVGFLERRGALSVGLFMEDWTDVRCQALIAASGEGELGVAVPPGTSPHLVASALKFYLARLRHPLLEVTQLDSIAALAGKKPSEAQPQVLKILEDATNQRSLMLLSVVMLALFRISAFSQSNLMTPDKLANAMVEAIAHRTGAQAITGLTLLIESAPKFFEAKKLSSSIAEKERRRLAYMGIMYLQDHLMQTTAQYCQWGFQRWVDTATKGICENLLKNTLREQGKGRIVLHKAVRHIRSTLLARGFQRWALLVDLKPGTITRQCQAKVEIYSRWGKMKYDSITQERRLLQKQAAESKESVVKLEARVQEMQTQLFEMQQEKDSLIKGNLIKIRRLAEIRADPTSANDVFDDPALSVLDAGDVASASAVAAGAGSNDDMVHKAELDEKQAEIDEIRKKLVERTEAMTAEINELKPEADEAAVLRVTVETYELLSQEMLHSETKNYQSLAIKTIQGHITAHYRHECGRLFSRWVYVINDKHRTSHVQLADRADGRLAKLQDINSMLENLLAKGHQQRALQRFQYLLSDWWTTSAEWALGRWQKSTCLRRTTISLQQSITPVVGKTVLHNELQASVEHLDTMMLISEGFNAAQTRQMRNCAQAISDRKILLDSSETVIRHAIKLDDHGRSIEGAELILCIERSIEFHLKQEEEDSTSDTGSTQLLRDLADSVETNEAIASLKQRAAEAKNVFYDLRSGWNPVDQTGVVRAFVKSLDPTSTFACVKAEGLINTTLSAILVTMLDADHFVEWLPLLVSAELIEDTDIFRRNVSIDFMAPGPYSNRNAKVHLSVIDNLDEDCIVVIAKSLTCDGNESAVGTEISIDHFGVVLKPITNSQTLVQLVLRADFKLPHNYLPPKVPQFMAEKVVSSIFGAIDQASCNTEQRDGSRKIKGNLLALKGYVNKRILQYFDYRKSEQELAAYDTIDDVQLDHLQNHSSDIGQLSDDLLKDFQFVVNDFQLSDAASVILQSAQDSGTLSDGLHFDNLPPRAPVVKQQSATVVPSKRGEPNILATLSKARQRSKVLTVAASCRRVQRGSAGTRRSRQRTEDFSQDSDQKDSTQEEEISTGIAEKHYLLFTSTGSAFLDIKAKTDRILMILETRKLQYDLVDLNTDPEIRKDMEELSGDGQTLPQLFIDGDYLIDGLEELQYMHDNDLL